MKKIAQVKYKGQIIENRFLKVDGELSNSNGNILKGTLKNGGNIYYSILYNGRTIQVPAQVLMAETFISSVKNSRDVKFRDKNRKNISLNNIYIVGKTSFKEMTSKTPLVNTFVKVEEEKEEQKAILSYKDKKRCFATLQAELIRFMGSAKINSVVTRYANTKSIDFKEAIYELMIKQSHSEIMLGRATNLVELYESHGTVLPYLDKEIIKDVAKRFIDTLYLEGHVMQEYNTSSDTINMSLTNNPFISINIDMEADCINILLSLNNINRLIMGETPLGELPF